MSVFIVEDILEIGYKVNLFNNKVLYVDKDNKQLVEYQNIFVGGKQKVINKIINSYNIRDKMPDIQKVIAIDNKIVASRRNSLEPLHKINSKISKDELKSKNFFLKANSMSFRKLSECQKKQVEKLLKLEDVQYCKFIDISQNTLVKTTAKGYRILAFFQTQ